MTEDDFWEIVEGCRAASGGDFAEQVRLQRARLLRLSMDELVSFGHWWEAVDDRAFTWPVWDVAALLMQGRSDDSFSDFRAWLISQGREVFERVTDEPDRLADVADAWSYTVCGHAETFGLQVLGVYEERTGSYDMPERESAEPSGPTGKSVNIEDERIARAHFPRMAAVQYGLDLRQG